ncbi:succinylglutamate desuccinylase/aspartoacylase family protein [Phycisphaera mikurensis]|uniref:Putative hydrolase n=1 Tax=Phycisphaera mikurensis (strain NBRC 102666 / KCTC 22515 / FYK2301M01) TaxID=1142394 RepID=I0IIU9_PHYMF|nr:succinylglutamate desuccinylase/aspartoacylase family protein [Phycisphaera mikurensis]MBB6443352.1 hypothetical protein [Phycisphaera mikurensis]BAM05187.1 putative hydrolase [Phycisphaera mikurensis NBRC 102666]
MSAYSFAGHKIPPGRTVDLRLPISERYTGDAIHLPVRVIRGKKPGPKVFVTAAVHGEELNGMGVVHDLMYGEPLALGRGTLALLPVVNIFGVETQSRYMPDRRDLNRCFPGVASGSLTSRVARTVFDALCGFDFGIDLHTAAALRTNFPNVRGDFSQAPIRRLARAFGCELMVNGKGPDGAFRREMVRAGCPTVVVEAGEPLKIEPGVLEVGLRGVRNVLKELDMLAGEPELPGFQVRIDKTAWVRATVGGILRFHVTPGQAVDAGQPIATNASVFGEANNVLEAPVDGVVLGMTTLPLVKPGEPVVHLATLSGRQLSRLRQSRREGGDDTGKKVRRQLATNITVADVDTAEREVNPPTPDEA